MSLHFPLRILVLCTGNSARSILTEALINHLGAGRFAAFSAGSHPTGKVNPFALETLRQHGITHTNARSKSWDEFAEAGASPIDVVITVCANAAGEVCPVWPGKPIKAHWGVDDPAAVDGTREDKQAAFEQAFAILKHRVEQLIALRVQSMDASALQAELTRIGESLP